MATNRSIDDLKFLFRDGQAPKSIGPDDFEDLIYSLHPSTGIFTDLPVAQGGLPIGRLWQNNGVIQMALGGGSSALTASMTGLGRGGLLATPRQRMLARMTRTGFGSLTANATVNSAGPTPAFVDDFNTFDQNNWNVDSFDEGGDAFWSADPADVAAVFGTSNGKLNLAIINSPSGGKSLTSGNMDTYNAPNNRGQAYGYWEVAVAVDRYNGFEWELDVLSVPDFLVDIAIVRIWTDGSNVQHVIQFAYGAPPLVEITSDSGWNANVNHTYGLEFTSTALRFYRDRVVVGNYGNPGGSFTNGNPLYAKTWANTNFASSAGVSVDPAGLPKYAHIDYLKWWPTRPF